MKDQTSMSMGADFCTFAWAAELCGVSIRTIARLTKEKAGRPPVLTSITPLVGSRESGRHKHMLYVSQVRAYHRARQMVKPS